MVNILWADDDINALFDESTKRAFTKLDVCVKQTFCNGVDLRNYLSDKEKMTDVDAVVVDVNFPSREWGADKEREMSGLNVVTQKIDSLRDKVPFFLYTAKKHLLDGENKDMFEYFYETDQIVSKNEGVYELGKRILNVLSKMKSPEWTIRTKYKELFERIDCFDKSCNANIRDLFTELLINIHNNTIEHAEDYFNQIRVKFFDKLHAVFAQRQICPEQLSLNEFSLFLTGKLTNYMLKEEILPSALFEEIKFVVQTIQDGSHGGSGLRLAVHQYVSNNHNSMMLPSIVFATLDIMNWASDYLSDHTDIERNAIMWERNNRTKEMYQNAKLRVEKDEQGTLHCGDCQIIQAGNEDKVGKIVTLLNVEDNKPKNGKTSKYMFFTKTVIL